MRNPSSRNPAFLFTKNSQSQTSGHSTNAPVKSLGNLNEREGFVKPMQQLCVSLLKRYYIYNEWLEEMVEMNKIDLSK